MKVIKLWVVGRVFSYLKRLVNGREIVNDSPFRTIFLFISTILLFNSSKLASLVFIAGAFSILPTVAAALLNKFHLMENFIDQAHVVAMVGFSN